MKTCTRCGLEKELSCFQTFNTPSGQKHRARCSACRNDDQKERYRNNPSVHRAYLLKAKYGLTLDDYDQLVVQQNGQCAICGTTSPMGHHKRFVVDHNHITGEVRGLLCSKCNAGLGNFSDNPALMLKAALYLDERGHYAKTN